MYQLNEFSQTEHVCVIRTQIMENEPHATPLTGTSPLQPIMRSSFSNCRENT